MSRREARRFAALPFAHRLRHPVAQHYKSKRPGENNKMKRILLTGAALLAATLPGGAANAQQTIKIGVILPLSGPFADTGVQIQNGIKLYMKQHGDTVAGKKIEVIPKDPGGTTPPVAKRLAQELVTRDQVDI